MRKHTTVYNILARIFFRNHKAEERNQEKLKLKTHRRQTTREFPKAPNRQAHRMAIWRQYRGI